MKQPLKSRRPSPAEALAVAEKTAPSLPPTKITTDDRPTTMTMRLRQGTVAAIAATARERGQTIKQVVAHALAQAGVAVAPADLEDRTPRRANGSPADTLPWHKAP
jgi:hypothetical protein